MFFVCVCFSGVLLQEQGKYHSAVEQYKEAIKHHPRQAGKLQVIWPKIYSPLSLFLWEIEKDIAVMCFCFCLCFVFLRMKVWCIFTQKL